MNAIGPHSADKVEPPTPRTGSSQIHGIDLLRFAAALLVACYHLGFAIWASPHRPPIDHDFAGLRPAAPLLGTGWIGVEIFFVISGFVIAYTANGRAPLAFVRSRFLRLFPAVAICATLGVPALLAIGVAPRAVAIGYVHSLGFWPHGPWMATAYWSLPVEIAFYAMVFALIVANGFRFVETAACALGGASAAVWIGHALLPAGSGAGVWVDHVVTAPLAALLLIHHGLYFAGGVLVWLVASRGWTVRRAGFLALFAAAALIEISYQATATAGFMRTPVSAPLATALFALGMAAIVGSIAANARISAALAPVLPLVRTLGLASYPLYLLHEPIGNAVIAAAVGVGLPDGAALGLSIALALALALVVARTIEPALRGWMGARLAGAGTRMPRWQWLHRVAAPV